MLKKIRLHIATLAVLAFGFYGCQPESELTSNNEVGSDVLAKLAKAGYNVQDQAPIAFDNGYLVEGDIYVDAAELDGLHPGHRLAIEEQYRTNNLVNAGSGRVVTVFIPQGGRTGFSSTYVSALDEAIARYNAENLTLTFQRVTSSSGASIVFTRLSKSQERQGVLGSAGFPTNGNPYNEIKMSGVLESSYGLGVNGIATIMAHEMGHCIGFRHTDYFDRSISCGGATSNEGASTVGAVHIPGTPTGATLSAQSWMLACTDGGNRPFNNDDKTALGYLY